MDLIDDLLGGPRGTLVEMYYDAMDELLGAMGRHRLEVNQAVAKVSPEVVMYINVSNMAVLKVLSQLMEVVSG